MHMNMNIPEEEKMSQTYTIKEKNSKLRVEAPYSTYMNTFYRAIGAKFDKPYRIADKEYHAIIMDRLQYCFGEANEEAVNLKIEVDSLNVSDRLVIAGCLCINVNPVKEEYELSKNTFIADAQQPARWITQEYMSKENILLEKLYGFLRPFKLRNSTLYVFGISRVRAQSFVDSAPKWAKKITIEDSGHTNFFDFANTKSY